MYKGWIFHFTQNIFDGKERHQMDIFSTFTVSNTD